MSDDFPIRQVCVPGYCVVVSAGKVIFKFLPLGLYLHVSVRRYSSIDRGIETYRGREGSMVTGVVKNSKLAVYKICKVQAIVNYAKVEE